jgi:hypothetical protein
MIACADQQSRMPGENIEDGHCRLRAPRGSVELFSSEVENQQAHIQTKSGAEPMSVPPAF